MTCNEVIEKIYTHPKINGLIDKINPADLRSDLKQEFALVMLSYPCKKILELERTEGLINYSLRTIWLMATSKESKFYRVYKKHDNKLEDYLRSFEGVELNKNLSVKASLILKEKMNIDAYQAHESIIFEKYAELQSLDKVAKYFSIPKRHVQIVVNNVKKEIKTKLQ